MFNVVELVSFGLKNEVSESDFLVASDKFNERFVSLQKGYISRKLLVEEETYFDLVVWETMDDAQSAAKAMCENPESGAYMSFIDEESCKISHMSVKKSY